MDAKEPKAHWGLRLGAFLLFCVTAFLPGMLFFGFVFAVTLSAVDQALYATFGVHLPTTKREPFRLDTSANHPQHELDHNFNEYCWECQAITASGRIVGDN